MGVAVGSGPPFFELIPVRFEQEDTACRPRACVVVNGIPFAIKSYRISKNAHGSTNTASFVLTYANNPDWTQQLFISEGETSPVYIEIWAGFPTNPSDQPSTSGLMRRFYGILDKYDPEDMSQTTFYCRSIAAPLTTDRITTQVQNLTTVQFVKQLAAPYGIPVVIDPALTNPFTLAKVYAQEYVVGLKNLVKWDVLQRASIFDDTDVWEDDGVLYYVHPWNVTSVMAAQKSRAGQNFNDCSLEYGTNVESFEPSHSPQFSRTIRVHVGSYSAKTRVSVNTSVQSVVGGITVKQTVKTSTATPQWGTNGGSSTTYYDNGKISYGQWSASGGSASGSNAPIAESGLEDYDFFFPNLTDTECQALTQTIWRQISQHEYQGEIKLVVTPKLLPYLNIENRFLMNGYGMHFFNVKYWPRTLDETFDGPGEPGSTEAGGWVVSMHALSHTPPLGSV